MKIQQCVRPLHTAGFNRIRPRSASDMVTVIEVPLGEAVVDVSSDDQGVLKVDPNEIADAFMVVTSTGSLNCTMKLGTFGS